jgi:predicted alpha/beta hydrolase family esterase
MASQRWALHASHARTSARNALRQLSAAARWRLPARRPAVPMLVLGSAADRLVSVECSIAIARQWSLPLVLHLTAGHEIGMDDPAWLARYCARWVGGVYAPGAP